MRGVVFHRNGFIARHCPSRSFDDIYIQPIFTVKAQRMRHDDGCCTGNTNKPHNIRELENLIERQVILSRGDKLTFDDLPAFQSNSTAPILIEKKENLTESDCDALRYQAIVSALQRAGGKLYGSNGAAEFLGIKPTTLASRMKKLGIDRRGFGKSI